MSNKIKSKKGKKCKKQTTKKYISRKSPPLPANECGKINPNMVMMGNDGNNYKLKMYKTKGKNVFRWVSVNNKQLTKKSKKINKTKKKLQKKKFKIKKKNQI